MNVRYIFINNLIKATNWRVKLWYGGALYDNSVSLETQPICMPENYFDITSSKTRYLRDLIIDIYLTAFIFSNPQYTKSCNLLRKYTLVNLLLGNVQISELLKFDITEFFFK